MRDSNSIEIKKREWLFDWHKEIKHKEREIYKLTIQGNTNVTQGLISLSKGPDHIFIHIVRVLNSIGEKIEFTEG
jgi:hypothetical protein